METAERGDHLPTHRQQFDGDAPAEAGAASGDQPKLVVAIRHSTCPFLDVGTIASRAATGLRLRRSALRDEPGNLLKVGLGARELTHDPAAGEYDDIVGHRHRLLQVVHD